MEENDESLNKMQLNSSLAKRQRKILRIKKIILDGASELFIKNKYENVSMSDIADFVAFSRATLYNYFATKEEIYFEIGTQYTKELTVKIRNIINNSKSGLDVVLSHCKIALEDILENPLTPQLLENLYIKHNEMNTFDSFTKAAIFDDYSTEFNAKIDALESPIKNFSKAYLAYRRLVISEFRRGKEDGSIKSSFEDFDFFSLLNILFLGTGSFFRAIMFPGKQIGLTGKNVIDKILNLIETRLTGKN